MERMLALGITGLIIFAMAIVAGCTDQVNTPAIVRNNPYVEVKAAFIVDSIGEKQPSLNSTYSQFLILDVIVVNPEESGHIFPVNSKTIMPLDGENQGEHIHIMDLYTENQLNLILSPGETVRGELVYLIAEGANYKYLWMNPGGVDLGTYPLPEIIHQTDFPAIKRRIQIPPEVHDEPSIEIIKATMADTLDGNVTKGYSRNYTKFLILDVRVENPEDSSYRFPVNEKTLRIINDENKSNYVTNTLYKARKYIPRTEKQLYQVISPGETVQGELIYEVPENSTHLYLMIRPDDNILLGKYPLPVIVYRKDYPY